MRKRERKMGPEKKQWQQQSSNSGSSKKTNYLFSNDLMHFDDLLYLFILKRYTRFIYIFFSLISLEYSTRIRSNLELKHFYKHELQINFIIESCKLCNILLLLLWFGSIWMIIRFAFDARTHCAICETKCGFHWINRF